MSPELEKLLAEAPLRQVFPKSQLIELGLAEGWPAELKQYFGHVTLDVSISSVVDTVVIQGVVSVEGNDELLSIPGVPYTQVPQLPYNQLPHGGWRPVLEAADQWRKNHDPVVHTVRRI